MHTLRPHTRPKGSKSLVLVITCEHGGNQVPPPYRKQGEKGLQQALATHRGYDIGALALALNLSERLQTACFPATVSRLLIDLNRSLHHPSLISEFFKHQLDAQARQELIRRHYTPHRTAVTAHIQREVAAGHRVVHIAVHSFTPILAGVTRQAECGLLYDPQRPGERAFCAAWAKSLAQEFRDWRVRRNYPYQGKADGFATHLRTLFPASSYAGIELEINNKLMPSSRAAKALGPGIAQSLQEGLQEGLQESL